MTTATTEGRRLKLTVDGIDEAFLVDPIPAKRGRYLTDRFVQASLSKLTPTEVEQIFIEAFGPANYSRMSGLYLDVVDVTGRDDDGEITAVSDPLITFGPEGAIVGDATKLSSYLSRGAIITNREARDDEPELDGEPIRHEEGETLCLCAFYWQTVVGMEGVEAVLEDDGRTGGSLKALSLLQTRTVLSPHSNSRSVAMESEIQRQADSEVTPATTHSFGSVPLPASKRGYGQNPNKSRLGKRR